MLVVPPSGGSAAESRQLWLVPSRSRLKAQLRTRNYLILALTVLEVLPSTVSATADFAAPGQRRSQPNIALIQADKIALRSGKQDFGVRAVDRHFDVVQSAVMAKACSIQQQDDLHKLGY